MCDFLCDYVSFVVVCVGEYEIGIVEVVYCFVLSGIEVC